MVHPNEYGLDWISILTWFTILICIDPKQYGSFWCERIIQKIAPKLSRIGATSGITKSRCRSEFWISEIQSNAWNIWGVPKMEVPKNGSLIRESPSIHGWFRGTLILGNLHIKIYRIRDENSHRPSNEHRLCQDFGVRQLSAWDERFSGSMLCGWYGIPSHHGFQ